MSAAPAAMPCGRCGRGLAESARFCRYCGCARGQAGTAPDTAPEPRPAEAPGAGGARGDFRLVIALFGAMFASSVLGAIARIWTGPVPVILGVTLSDAAMATGAALLLRRADMARLLRWRLPGAGGLARMAAAGLASVALTGCYFAVLRALHLDFISMTAPFRASHWGTAGMLLVTCALPAVFEELAFRGLIQGELDRLMGPAESLVVQAAMFSTAHFLPLSLPSHFILGLWFGYVRRCSGSLLPGIVLHGGWNAAMVLQEMSVW